MMNFGGGGVGWSVMVVGPFMVLIGLVAAALIVRSFYFGGTSRNLQDRRDKRASTETFAKKRDPLEVVRERYARGEINHEELEQYVSNLLRSEEAGHLGDKTPK